MAWAFFIISLVISLVIVGGAIFMSKRVGGGGSREETEALKQEAQVIEEELRAGTERGMNFASKAQIDSVSSQAAELIGLLESQKGVLKEIEEKLETAQKNVETKESQQQEMKSAKEEDELKLEELMSHFETVSSESVNLEQELAQSLKSVDGLLVEIPLTADQKIVFQELSNALTAAGGRLRDLITDYQAVRERLENLKLQHQDLEDEYTKLVEQQLGA